MKCVLFVLLIIALGKETEKEPVLTDAELEEMMKDPKYKDLLEEAKSAGVLPKNQIDIINLPNKPEEVKKLTETKKSFETHSVNSHVTLPNTVISEPKPVVKKEEKLNLISKDEAAYLVEVLNQPAFFNYLPKEAQTIITTAKNDGQLKTRNNSIIVDKLNEMLVNLPNSVGFIDTDGKLGRKGSLTVIDPSNGETQFVWAVANNKVFCLFRSQSFLSINKIIRNSSLRLKDVPATPCFMAADEKESNGSWTLLCSLTVQEKEMWVTTLDEIKQNK